MLRMLAGRKWIPKTMKEMMEVLVLGVKSKIKSIHSIDSNHLKLFEYLQG